HKLSNYSVTSTNGTLTITQAPTTTTITSALPATSVVGQAYTVTVALASAGGIPSGSVAVDDGSGATCTILLSNGSGSCSLTSATAGTKTLTAKYPGDTNFAASQGTATHTASSSLGFNGLLNPYVAPTITSSGLDYTTVYTIKSAVPLKWQYTSGGTAVNSSSANPTVAIYPQQGCNDTNTSDDQPITVTAVGSTTPTYDPSSLTWQLNWKTTGLAAGCYNIVVMNGQTQQTNGPFPIKLVTK
ncbi:MAG: hypothetical protein DMG24_21840, partial [Acidobacteria bacterium]